MGPVLRPEDDAPVGSASDVSSPSVRLTPESGFENEDGDGRFIQEEEGMELRELNTSRPRTHSPRPQGERRGITESETEDLDEDEEDDSMDHEHGETSSSRARQSSVASFELYTPDEERAVRWKMDTRLVLFVAVLYMMSFLDRSNIGNAKVAGLTHDLNLSDSQFGWLLSAFYITYILFEWMTLCYKIFPPHIYVACCTLAWGVLASLQSLATSFTYMIVIRALLGIGEAAFVGMPFYLSFFFRREELALRVGLFISAAPLAEAFASSLAFAIVSLGDRTSVASWRLLFIIEGFPACVLAAWTWYWLPDSPATARWLSSRERRIANLRLRNEHQPGGLAEKANVRNALPRHKRKFKWAEVVNTLRDPKSYLTAGMFFCCNVAFSSMPVFLPSIVNSMGYTRLEAQGLSAPPFLFAFVVVLLTAFLSDRYQCRSIPMMFHAGLALAGYVFAALASTFRLDHTLRYLAIYPICAGFFSAVTVVITWTINNQASDEGKGTGMAILNVFGQMGPLLGTRLYPDADKPYYIKGNVVCAVSMGLVVVLAFILRQVLFQENRRRRVILHEAEGEALVSKSRDTKEFIYMI